MEVVTPQYYFDVRNDVHDSEGIQLPNDRAAQYETIGVLQEMGRSLGLDRSRSTTGRRAEHAGGVILRTTGAHDGATQLKHLNDDQLLSPRRITWKLVKGNTGDCYG